MRFAAREHARTWACAQLLQRLQHHCYTIRAKPTVPRPALHIDGAFIDANMARFVRCTPDGSVHDTTRLTADNKGFQMMRQLGWAGGALGTSGRGIEEPIQVQTRAKRCGLGAERPADAKARLPDMHAEFFEALLRWYATATNGGGAVVTEADDVAAGSAAAATIMVRLPAYGAREWKVLAE